MPSPTKSCPGSFTVTPIFVPTLDPKHFPSFDPFSLPPFQGITQDFWQMSFSLVPWATT